MAPSGALDYLSCVLANEVSPRERIINSLAAMIARDGYRGSKIQDVAALARVSLRTFYEEFPSKEACFLELHARVVERVISTVDQSVSFDRPWREVMRQGFESYYALLLSQPRLTTAIMLELTTISEASYAAREHARDQLAEMLRDLVDRGRAANPDIPSRSLSPLMARCVLGGVLELVTSRVQQGQIDRLPELVDTSTDMLWTIVTSPEYAVA